MRENRTYGSEGGVSRWLIPTPIAAWVARHNLFQLKRHRHYVKRMPAARTPYGKPQCFYII